MSASEPDHTTVRVLTPLTPGAVATVRVQGPLALPLLGQI